MEAFWFWFHALFPFDLCRGENYCHRCGAVQR
jgi:hypothetical protein